MAKIVKIYTDGSSNTITRKGGWGFILVQDCENHYFEIEYSAAEENTTNNRMELTAVIEGLLYVKKTITPEKYIEIYSDSQYVVNGITEWINSWKKTNYKKGKMPNIDLWKKLDILNTYFKGRITWNWVKAHNGDKYNEIADKLSRCYI